MDRVLVLNSDYTPLNVTDLRRGFILVSKGKAEIVKEDVKKIVTTIGEFVRPLIIRLVNYVRFRRGSIKVGRQRIFKRDKYECGYCGSKKNLTIDHIIPRSKGGDNSWNNLITCCNRCNNEKDDKTLEEAGMKLRFQPFEPTIFSAVISEEVETIWNNFKNNWN
jgi:CRISPR/Cas system Type II protein with McrA/HNH and RuvC-like nuclease domain